MDCEIITIGDELLIGQVIDTNSAWMATRLNESGFRVKQIISVSDDLAHICRSVDEALARVGIVLLTGGLGPTRDDLTKDALCSYFSCGLVTDDRIIDDLTRYFSQRGRPLTETNRKQAEVPEKCRPLYNQHGTAPGMWFDPPGGKVLVSMPGVPYEMKAMMDEQVLPELRERFRLPPVYHQTIITTGVGESYLADQIREWEVALPEHIRLAYLPSVGMVKLRLSCYGATEEKIGEVLNEVSKLKSLISKYIYVIGDFTLQEALGELLKSKGQTLAIAESCTGGYLSHLVTSVPGSSAYYIGSTISYANEVKSRFLGVDPEIISREGAVSEMVAKAMAAGVREKLGTTWSLSTTGIAGPAGSTPEKPVGTVWIGMAGPSGVAARKFQFGQDRMRNIQATGVAAFTMLRNAVAGNES
jgi:nicotinamide-nucleotide amidase